jgi:hypothetical protein
VSAFHSFFPDLNKLMHMSSLASPSFHDIVPILQLAATESLDIYRALMPVVHAKEVEDVPALAMQFANDCEELALHAKELQAKFGWNAKGAESRLEALSKTVQDRQIVSTPRGLAI